MEEYQERYYIYNKKRVFFNDKKDVAIVTKSGYLTSSDTSLFSPSDYVQLNEKSYHSISPKVIEKQIETSLQRLKTNKIDIFMINAPERMLMAKNKVYHYIFFKNKY
jgi:aryl-alcohol dehydrogenase-like predicted oxidoreductase